MVPIYFAGANSLAFQIAGLVHARLRTARLAGELFNKRGSQVVVRIGASIGATELAKQGSIERVTQYLRARTYVLSHHRIGRPQHKAVDLKIVSFQTFGLKAEMERLKNEGCIAVENESYAVFRARGSEIPALMREIGRARELAFRAAGEGTGKDVDLDVFDPSYTHLILWHKASDRIAGSYRLAARSSARNFRKTMHRCCCFGKRLDVRLQPGPRRPFCSGRSASAQIIPRRPAGLLSNFCANAGSVPTWRIGWQRGGHFVRV